MISTDHVRTMARYNRWQNESLFSAAAGLSDDARRLHRGAFFGSIHGTLSHLLWGDRVWMSRFAGTSKPAVGIKDSPSFVAEWSELARERAAFDFTILSWAEALDAEWLAGELRWFSGVLGRDMTTPRWLAVTHFFNHQTHHRGQVHTMLTAAGAKPDDTDLIFMTR